MNITDLLTTELVLPSLEARDKDAVLLALAGRVVGCRDDVDGTVLVEGLRDRERQSSTALVDGVAVPHAKLPGLSRMVAALARSVTGIDCDSDDGRPTHLFFLLVGAAERPGEHVKALAAVSRLLHDGRCRARLMAADDEAAMLAVLREHASPLRAA
jgi:nitrogen PTS system EIIA component